MFRYIGYSEYGASAIIAAAAVDLVVRLLLVHHRLFILLLVPLAVASGFHGGVAVRTVFIQVVERDVCRIDYILPRVGVRMPCIRAGAHVCHTGRVLIELVRPFAYSFVLLRDAASSERGPQ